MNSLQQPTDQDRPVVRLRFSRFEPAVWLAHLDLMRTFERAIRRAGLPVAYSHGFNPRPQQSFALPIGVGLATLDDYVDVFLTSPVTPEEVRLRLNQSLPPGIEILMAETIKAEGPSLMSLVRAADYRLKSQGLGAAARRLLACPADLPWPVDKNSKGKLVSLNIRPLLLDLKIDAEDQLTVRVKAGSSENMRPDLFLAALVQFGGLDAQAAADAEITRLHLLIASPNNPAVLQSPLQLPDGN